MTSAIYSVMMLSISFEGCHFPKPSKFVIVFMSCACPWSEDRLLDFNSRLLGFFCRGRLVVEKAEKDELHVSVLELRCSLHLRLGLLTMAFNQQSLNNQHSFVVAAVLLYLRP